MYVKERRGRVTKYSNARCFLKNLIKKLEAKPTYIAKEERNKNFLVMSLSKRISQFSIQSLEKKVTFQICAFKFKVKQKECKQ